MLSPESQVAGRRELSALDAGAHRAPLAMDRRDGHSVPCDHGNEGTRPPPAGTAMSEPDRDPQVHVRVSAEFKRALKVFCAKAGTTEQAWVVDLLEVELARRAPDLWKRTRAKSRQKAGR